MDFVENLAKSFEQLSLCLEENIIERAEKRKNNQMYCSSSIEAYAPCVKVRCTEDEQLYLPDFTESDTDNSETEEVTPETNYEDNAIGKVVWVPSVGFVQESKADLVRKSLARSFIAMVLEGAKPIEVSYCGQPSLGFKLYDDV